MDGMCYLIESNLTLIADGGQGDELIITAKKLSKQNNIKELNVWLTSDYDYLAVTHDIWGHSRHELLYLLDNNYFSKGWVYSPVGF